jgi:hypothetical protein
LSEVFQSSFVTFIRVLTGYVLGNTIFAKNISEEEGFIVKKKLFYGIPLVLAIFIGGCSSETDQENEPPVEDTENDVEDEDFKLNQEESDGDEKQ